MKLMCEKENYMAEISLKKYKNILGSAKETIEAIQKYINNNQSSQNKEIEEQPAASINRILDSVADEEIANDVNKIINNMK